ncbi:MAG: AAA family ATPase, partial [Negativicoccus succinicivorans]|uniref:DNA repair protein RecN n=1 Tax=Negativicoccus succinicivorans TaxID=620903 RepID=UPI0026E9C3F3
MLQSLHIRNFALIEQLDIEFKEGVTVFTGETGAGKSILLDALGIALGNRAAVDYIRTGTEEFFVTAQFDVTDMPSVQTYCNEQNIPLTDDEPLIISRRLSQTGKGQILVNGMLTSLRTLAGLGSLLVDIHGQNDNLKLQSDRYQLHVLDTFNRDGRQPEAIYHKAYQTWQQAVQRQRKFLEQEDERETLLARLNKEAREISAAKINPEKDADIEAEIKRLAHAEKITAALQMASQLLNASGGSLETISQALNELQKASSFDEALLPSVQTLETAFYNTEEVARNLQESLYTIEYSPERLDQLQERAQLLKDLRLKYGDTLEEILVYQATIQKKITELENSQETGDTLAQAVATAFQEAQTARDAWNETRYRAAAELSGEIESALRDLDLPNGSLSYSLILGDTLTSQGLAEAELVFSANVGEPPKPLSEVGSGGELARISLALKTVLAAQMDLPTLVLDEIDVGISGNAALRVA